MAGTRLPRSLGLSAGAASRSSAPSLGPSGRSARARAASPAGPESPCRPFLPREARPALPRARHRPPRGVSLQLAASPPRPGRGRPAGCGLDGLERRGACPQPRAGVRFSGRGARLRPRGGGRRGGQNGLRPGCRFHRTPGPRTCGLPGHSSLLGARPDCPTGRGSSADSLGPPPPGTNGLFPKPVWGYWAAPHPADGGGPPATSPFASVVTLERPGAGALGACRSATSEMTSSRFSFPSMRLRSLGSTAHLGALRGSLRGSQLTSWLGRAAQQHDRYLAVVRDAHPLPEAAGSEPRCPTAAGSAPRPSQSCPPLTVHPGPPGTGTLVPEGTRPRQVLRGPARAPACARSPSRRRFLLSPTAAGRTAELRAPSLRTDGAPRARARPAAPRLLGADLPLGTLPSCPVPDRRPSPGCWPQAFIPQGRPVGGGRTRGRTLGPLGSDPLGSGPARPCWAPCCGRWEAHWSPAGPSPTPRGEPDELLASQASCPRQGSCA